MAGSSKGAGCLTLFAILAVVGGCMQLFGYETESEKAAAIAETARAAGLPDLVGKSLTEAQNTARTMDIRLDDEGIGVISSCRDKTDCIVFRMSPHPGAVVEKFGEVSITWATGEEEIGTTSIERCRKLWVGQRRRLNAFSSLLKQQLTIRSHERAERCLPGSTW